MFTKIFKNCIFWFRGSECGLKSPPKEAPSGFKAGPTKIKNSAQDCRQGPAKLCIITILRLFHIKQTFLGEGPGGVYKDFQKCKIFKNCIFWFRGSECGLKSPPKEAASGFKARQTKISTSAQDRRQEPAKQCIYNYCAPFSY